MRLSRWPNDGYIEIDSIVSRGAIPRDGDSTGQGGAFISKSLTPNLLPPIDNIYLNGYWCYKWYDEAIKIGSVDRESGRIELAAPHNYGIGGPSGGLFYGINAPEFLDQPGEYYYDQNNGTIRMMLPAMAAEETVVEISYKDFTLLDIRNSTSLTIEGIKLCNHSGLAVNIEDSDTVKIQACRFSGLAQSAVNISGGTQYGLYASIIENIGATGISIDGGDKASLTPAGHYVVKCNIHHYAGHVKTYAPAVRLSGVGHYVADNFISDAPHNAILFSGNDHLIELNQLCRIFIPQ